MAAPASASLSGVGAAAAQRADGVDERRGDRRAGDRDPDVRGRRRSARRRRCRDTTASDAPELTPRMPGSASGLRVTPCITAPDSPSAAPTSSASSVRGIRFAHRRLADASARPPPSAADEVVPADDPGAEGDRAPDAERSGGHEPGAAPIQAPPGSSAVRHVRPGSRRLGEQVDVVVEPQPIDSGDGFADGRQRGGVLPGWRSSRARRPGSCDSSGSELELLDELAVGVAVGHDDVDVVEGVAGLGAAASRRTPRSPPRPPRRLSGMRHPEVGEEAGPGVVRGVEADLAEVVGVEVGEDDATCRASCGMLGDRVLDLLVELGDQLLTLGRPGRAPGC